MAQQNWLSRKAWEFLLRLGQRQAKGADAARWSGVRSELWTRMLRASRRGRNKSQRLRRRLVIANLVWISFFAPIDSWLVWTHDGRVKAVDGAFLLIPLFIAWMALIQMRKSLPASTLDEYALAVYGSAFLALDESERSLAFLEYQRDEGLREDEHEAELRVRSNATAYRILSCCLLVAAAIYLWVVSRPESLVKPQVIFQISADIAIWFASITLVLPTMLRMWTQPDNPAEPELVVAARKEA